MTKKPLNLNITTAGEIDPNAFKGIATSGYAQVVPQTHEEKVAMYMKCTKKELVEMVIECNRILDNIRETSRPIYADAMENGGWPNWITTRPRFL